MLLNLHLRQPFWLWILSDVALSGDQMVNGADEDNRAHYAEKDVEDCHPAVVVCNRAETVRAYRASKVAEAVKDSRKLARIYLALQVERHHTYYYVIYTRHKRRDERE